MGSKNKYAKEILKVILPHRTEGQLWVEPFVGGCNMLDKVSNPRLGSDIDQDLITLWDAVSKGYTPPKYFTEGEYREIKTSESTPTKGYAAFALSYGGKKFGGWCRDSEGKRDYVDEAYRNAIKQFPKLLNVNFVLSDYLTLNIPNGSLVYCDPPYRGTTGYKFKFNHDEFWDWVRYTSKNNKVFISEYTAPDDFYCLWEKNVKSSLTGDTGARSAVEKLFCLTHLGNSSSFQS